MGSKSGLEDRSHGESVHILFKRKITDPWLQVDDARKKVHEADALIAQRAREAEDKMSNLAHNAIVEAEESAKQARKDANKSIENFDKTVERKVVEAKSGISSWFGFGK